MGRVSQAVREEREDQAGKGATNGSGGAGANSGNGGNGGIAGAGGDALGGSIYSTNTIEIDGTPNSLHDPSDRAGAGRPDRSDKFSPATV